MLTHRILPARLLRLANLFDCNRIRLVRFSLFLTLALVFTRWYWGCRCVQITLSPSTTRITTILNSDGTPNYLAALNAHYSAGVTPENNAAVPLIRLSDLDAYDPACRYRFARALRAPQLEEPSANSISIGSFHCADLTGPAESQWYDQAEAAARAPWTPCEHPELFHWLAANAHALNLIEAAAQLPRYCIPLIQDPDNPSVDFAMIPSAVSIRLPAHALAARAMLRLGSGDLYSSCSDAFTVIRLGTLLSQQPTPIERVASISIINDGLRVLFTALQSPYLARVHAQEVSDQLARLPQIPTFSDCLDYYLRYATLDRIVRSAHLGGQFDPDSGVHSFSLGLFPVSFDHILQQNNLDIDRLVDASARESFAARQAAFDAISFSVPSRHNALSVGEQSFWGISDSLLQRVRANSRLADDARQWEQLIQSGWSARAQLSAYLSNDQLQLWTRSQPPNLFTGKPLVATLLSCNARVCLTCPAPEPCSPQLPMPEGITSASSGRFSLTIQLLP